MENDNIYFGYYDSPAGTIEIYCTENKVTYIGFCEEKTQEERSNEYVQKVISQLQEYFSGTRKEFDMNFEFDGTQFQKKVWKALCTIPYGETVSYEYIAKMIGEPKAARAVGGANHRNKISIVIPCHRVIGKNKTLVGYGGGLDKKQWLIEHEKNNIDKLRRSMENE